MGIARKYDMHISFTQAVCWYYCRGFFQTWYARYALRHASCLYHVHVHTHAITGGKRLCV